MKSSKEVKFSLRACSETCLIKILSTIERNFKS